VVDNNEKKSEKKKGILFLICS